MTRAGTLLRVGPPQLHLQGDSCRAVDLGMEMKSTLLVLLHPGAWLSDSVT